MSLYVTSEFEASDGIRSSITYKRHTFFTRKLEPKETYEQYMTALRDLSYSCGFQDLRDELVRDLFICGIRDRGLQEKLLILADTDEQKMLDVCRNHVLVTETVNHINGVFDNITRPNARVTGAGNACKESGANEHEVIECVKVEEDPLSVGMSDWEVLVQPQTDVDEETLSVGSIVKNEPPINDSPINDRVKVEEDPMYYAPQDSDVEVSVQPQTELVILSACTTVKDEPTATQYDNPTNDQEGEGNEVGSATAILQSWRLKPETVTTLLGLGYDRPDSLETLASRDTVNLVQGVSFAEKALICQKCSHWLSTRGSSAEASLAAPDMRTHLASPLTPPPASCQLVRDLLRTSSDPYLRVIAGQPGPLTTLQVRKLGAAVVKHLINQSIQEGNSKGTIHYSKFREWAASIAACFQGEQLGLWFEVQRKLSSSDTKLTYRPSGRLWDRYSYERRKFKTEEGRPIKTPAHSAADNATTQSMSSTSKKKRVEHPPTQNAEELRTELTQDDDFKLLLEIAIYEGSESAQFIEAWKKTADKRIAYCRAANFGEYSNICCYYFLPIVGHKLVDLDYRHLFPDFDSSALNKGLRRYRDAIFVLASLERDKQRTPERKAVYSRPIEFYKEAEESQKSAAALILLPFVVKGGLSAMQVVKISAIQSSEYFLLRAISLEAAEEVLRGRRADISEKRTQCTSKKGRQALFKGSRVQPLILAVGGDGLTWGTVERYWVYIGKPLYEFDNITDAVDCCFKAIFVFNLEYAPECESVWQVLQVKFFGLQLPNTVLYRSSISCIALLDNFLETLEVE